MIVRRLYNILVVAYLSIATTPHTRMQTKGLRKGTLPENFRRGKARGVFRIVHVTRGWFRTAKCDVAGCGYRHESWCDGSCVRHIHTTAHYVPKWSALCVTVRYPISYFNPSISNNTIENDWNVSKMQKSSKYEKKLFASTILHSNLCPKIVKRIISWWFQSQNTPGDIFAVQN